MQDFHQEKKKLGLRYALSLIIPAGITIFIAQADFSQKYESYRKYILSIVNTLPFGIDWILKKCEYKFLLYQRKKKNSEYESNIQNILDDPKLTEEQQMYYQDELNNFRKTKLLENKNEIKNLNNQIVDLEK